MSTSQAGGNRRNKGCCLMKRRILAIWLMIAGGVLSFASAQEASDESAGKAPPPNPCEAAPYRAFDFWIGDWNVFSPDGDKLGENTITKEEGGCLLLEKWTSASGGTGQSYNYYDPGTKKFRQIWIASWGTIDYAGGLNDAGEMVLEGEISYPNSTMTGFRGTWTAQEDGSVRQYFQQFNGETEVWDDWFIGIYRKKSE